VRELVCNYAIARFRPYRETGEFANVGVVLLCPEVDFFGYLFERHKYKRITDFFPELDSNIFKAGLSGFLKELSRVTSRDNQATQLVLRDEVPWRIAAFKEVVRTRETIFHFGEVATVLATDPRAKLDELFNFYIKRQFASDREYQEIIMRRSLGDFLQKIKLAPLYKLDHSQQGYQTSSSRQNGHHRDLPPRRCLDLDRPTPGPHPPPSQGVPFRGQAARGQQAARGCRPGDLHRA
jgi:Protein of unknown function (DUF3037)